MKEITEHTDMLEHKAILKQVKGGNEIMEIEEKLKVGIGTKEPEKLKTGKVIVVSIEISKPKNKSGEVIKGKDGKELSDKVSFGCKHPDSEDLIQLSKAKVLKGDKIKEVGLWFELDSDNMLPKNSALSLMLNHYGAKNISEIASKEIKTTQDENGYLCIKAY